MYRKDKFQKVDIYNLPRCGIRIPNLHMISVVLHPLIHYEDRFNRILNQNTPVCLPFFSHCTDPPTRFSSHLQLVLSCLAVLWTNNIYSV